MTSATEQFGVHIMIDGYGAPLRLLADKAHLTGILLELPRAIGMHPISKPTVVEVGPMNRKDPGGISGFIMIAESHISFHTFPRRGFVTIDLYTCQGVIDRQHTISLLKQGFGLSDADVFIQNRGLRYPSENLHEAESASYERAGVDDGWMDCASGTCDSIHAPAMKNGTSDRSAIRSLPDSHATSANRSGPSAADSRPASALNPNSSAVRSSPTSRA
jgi:S-adenosylmethionine decarboxylase